jgi:hypothetical protein
MRGLRWILLGLILVVVAGAVALVVVERPKLDDARTAVNAAWSPLRAPLRDRYDKLNTALGAFTDAGGGSRTVAKDLGAALTRWDDAVKRGDPGAEASAANDLEGEGTRLRANVLASDRLKGVTPLTDALVAFDGSTPPVALVDAYNRRVRSYEDQRTSTTGTPVARVLGFDERSVLMIGG